MLRPRLCELLEIEFPIISAPMGPDLAGPDLVAAVSGAGGLGLMQAQLSPPEDLLASIRRVRERTNKPFGVCFILALPYQRNLEVCVEESVPIIGFFWGGVTPLVDPVHDSTTGGLGSLRPVCTSSGHASVPILPLLRCRA